MFTAAHDTPLETVAINPSVLHSFSSPSFHFGSTVCPPSSTELSQSEETDNLANDFRIQPKVSDSAGEVYHANTALPSLLEPANTHRPNSQEHKPRLGRGFPSKLYFMLEDEGLKKYVSWSKIKGKDAFVIPDIEAFVADALPTHFEEMKQWGSFQKQLNNYDFKRQDRGPNKAVYAHAMFLQGRPDLLANVRCRPKRRSLARRGPKRPSTPIPPTAGNTPLTSGSQTDSPSYNDQLEHDNKELKRTVSELEVRVQTLETRLQLMETREQLKESSKRPEGISTEDRALDSVVDPGSAQSVHQIDALHRALIASVDTGGEALGYQFGPLQTLSWEAYPTKESAYDPVDPPLGLGFGPLQTLPWEAYLTTELLNDPVDPLFGLEFLAP